LIILLFFVTLVISSCNSSRRIGGSSKNCGCGSNKGMVGY
jgi:hypothetical protein